MGQELSMIAAPALSILFLLLVRQPQAVMFEALSLVVAAFGAGLVESAPV
jgi:hypothetical protein